MKAWHGLAHLIVHRNSVIHLIAIIIGNCEQTVPILTSNSGGACESKKESPGNFATYYLSYIIHMQSYIIIG